MIKNTTDRIDQLISHTADCAAHTDAYAPDDDHDYASRLMRDLLIMLDDLHSLDLITHARYALIDDDATPTLAQRRIAIELRDLLLSLRDTEYARDAISHLAISESLCPLHLVDWAICFDDDDPDCAQIRTIFPSSHDT